MRRDELRAERITMLTDLLLAAVAGVLAIALLGGARGAGPEALAWGLALLFTAAAAVAGGVFHGLRHRLTAATGGRIWSATLYLGAVAAFFVMAAGALALPPSGPRSTLLWVALAKLAAMVVLLRRTVTFGVVAADSGVSLLVVAAVAVWGAAGTRPAGAGWLLAGVAASLVGAALQQSRWRHDRNFDHNDLFHLAQTAACLLFYQGVGGG